jgi:hypothetical protein
MRLYTGGDDDAGEESGADPAGEAMLPVPAGPNDLAGHYDVTISHPLPVPPQFAAFDRWLAGATRRFDLSCALIHEGLLAEAVRRLGDGRLTVGYHLDYFALWHVPDDPWAQLVEAVQDAGGKPVNPPARSRAFTDKAAAHAELARRGLGTPATAVLRPWAPDRPLTAAERGHLRLEESGASVFVKPANGFGGHGIIRVDHPTPEALATALAVARHHDPRDSYLVQREVRFPTLACADGVARPAYWRVIYCLGELLPFWWQPQDRSGAVRHSYHPLTKEELRRLGLRPVLDYARDLAAVFGLEWFSTELCLSDGPEPSNYVVMTPDGRCRPVVAIDPLNDQCDVDVQSRWPGAAPDEVVRGLAARFARAAWVAKVQPRRVAA